MKEPTDGFDFDLTMSPMVARAMLKFARLMEKQQPGKWQGYIELYESLIKTMAEENLLRHILEGTDDDLDN